MPKRTNNKKKITKTTKRKSCMRTNKTTGIAFAGIKTLMSAVCGDIMSFIPNVASFLGDIGLGALSAASLAAGFVGPALWDGVKYLTKTGFKSLYHFLVDFWKDETSDTIPTDNIKAIIVDLKKQLIRKDPELKHAPIMDDLAELNKLCFIIDSMNEEGLTSKQYDELKKKLTEDLKYIFREFREIMSS